MNLDKSNFVFDIEKELQDPEVRSKKIKEWKNKVIILMSELRKGVTHDHHDKIGKLLGGYKNLIEFVESIYLNKE